MAQKNIQSWRPDLSGVIHPKAISAFNLLFDAIQDHDTAIVAVNKKVTTPATTPAAVAPSTPSSSSSPSSLGLVNVQTGTTYATMLTDNGGLLVLSNAAPVAVTLSATVAAPWFMSVVNLGSANAVFTPSSGTINNVSSLTLGPNGGAFIYFDGTSFWAPFIPIVPATKTLVANQWLASYDASTGLFVSSQPSFANISGAAVVGQIPALPQSQITGLVSALALLAPIASPTFTGTVTQPTPSVLTAATTTTSATAGTATALPALPAAYLTVSINGTSYKIALFLP